MNEKTASLLKGLKYSHAPQKVIAVKHRNDREPQLIRVEYFVDLVARRYQIAVSRQMCVGTMIFLMHLLSIRTM